jgi:hypothetical protein
MIKNCTNYLIAFYIFSSSSASKHKMCSWFLLFIFLINIFNAFSSACPTNSLPWQSQCVTFFDTLKGFSDAEKACIQLNGHLISIHDGFINSFISQEAAKYVKTSDLWIGATKMNNNETWQWTDGSKVDFKDWENGHPNNSTKNNCATFAISNGYWNAQECSIKKPFVCLSATTATTAGAITASTTVPSPTPSSNSSCDNGWKYFAESKACYLLFNQSEVEQWQQAENVCIQHGSHLSSLHSQDEALFLLSYEEQLGYALWIGLITNDNGYTWKWSDGTKTDYMPWRQGFPYLGFGHNSCGLLMTDNGNPVYENLECSFSQPFMCKKLLL